MTVFIIFICITVVLSAPLPKTQSDEEDATDVVAELRSVVGDAEDHVIKIPVDNDDPRDPKEDAAIRTLSDLSNVDNEAKEGTDLTNSALSEKIDSNHKDDENTDDAFRALINDDLAQDRLYSGGIDSNNKDNENTETAFREMINEINLKDDENTETLSGAYEDDLKRVVDRDMEGSNRAVTTEAVVIGVDDGPSSRALNEEDNLNKEDDQGTEASNRAMATESEPDKADETVAKVSNCGPTEVNAENMDGSLSFSYGTSFSYGGGFGNYVPPAIIPFNYGDFFNIGAGFGIPYVTAIPGVTAVSDMFAKMFGGFSFG